MADEQKIRIRLKAFDSPLGSFPRQVDYTGQEPGNHENAEADLGQVGVLTPHRIGQEEQAEHGPEDGHVGQQQMEVCTVHDRHRF